MAGHHGTPPPCASLPLKSASDSLDVVERVCHRVAIMVQGKLTVCGTPAELLSGRMEPASGGTALPVFAGRGGRLRVNGLTAGRWTLVLESRPQRRHTLVIPADARGVVDLGVLKP